MRSVRVKCTVPERWGLQLWSIHANTDVTNVDTKQIYVSSYFNTHGGTITTRYHFLDHNHEIQRNKDTIDTKIPLIQHFFDQTMYRRLR